MRARFSPLRLSCHVPSATSTVSARAANASGFGLGTDSLVGKVDFERLDSACAQKQCCETDVCDRNTDRMMNCSHD
jgi:hypothetical protein